MQVLLGVRSAESFSFFLIVDCRDVFDSLDRLFIGALCCFVMGEIGCSSFIFSGIRLEKHLRNI